MGTRPTAADHKVHHTFIEAVCLGILANLMVCLAIWMSHSGRSLMDKALIMALPVAMFVASGFEHSIDKYVHDPDGYCNPRLRISGILDRGRSGTGKFFSPDRDELHH